MHTKRFVPLALLTLALASLTFPLPAQAQKQTPAPQTLTQPQLTILHWFADRDGIYPDGVTMGADGSLYGTASQGGLSGGGTVFKLTRGGLFHKLADLYQQNGVTPLSPLLLMPDGSLMGAASGGGKSGTGALFLLTPPHRFQTKHEFAPVSAGGANVRGAHPGPLVLGPDGAVYGTTSGGGTGGSGIVYRWTAAHGVEVVHDFAADGSEGRQPQGLTLGPDGALYGVAFDGGSQDYGTIFRVTPDGLFTTLHSFTHDAKDGKGPRHPPVAGPDGALYGLVPDGGIGFYTGTAYRITPDGTFTLLHMFDPSREGFEPTGLTLGPDGNLYGFTGGGNKNHGTLFRMTPAGVLTTICAFPKSGFPGGPDTLVFGADGVIYGSAYTKVVFKLRLP